LHIAFNKIQLRPYPPAVQGIYLGVIKGEKPSAADKSI
jgi:hypothetical protein